jgi:GxxExxY protein
MSALKYGYLTGRIIAAAMEVHNTMGCGFQEYMYQRALEIEFKARNIHAIREFEMPIHYKGAHIATRRVDFLVEHIISVEIKAMSKTEAVHFVQAINYLEAYNLEIGLLINFGAASLEFKRLHNKQFRSLTG